MLLRRIAKCLESCQNVIFGFALFCFVLEECVIINEMMFKYFFFQCWFV